MWWWLAVAAWAQGADQLRTTLGVAGVHAASIGQTDVNLLLAERARWSLGEPTRLWLDAAFTIDPDAATTFERSRVRALGVTVQASSVRLWIGRSLVQHGGPRLVDGVQAVWSEGPWELGAWGGLAPDLFTTRPELRPGGGPILAYVDNRAQLSLTGEVVGAEGGLDRAGALAQARVHGGRLWDLSTRLDWALAEPDTGSGLSDAAAFLQVRPSDAVSVDLVYNAFSAYRYQQTALLDPTLQRFAARVDPLALFDGLSQDRVDPTVHHLVGATPEVHIGAMQLAVLGRARLGALPAEQFVRLQPRVAARGLADGRLDLELSSNLVRYDAGWNTSTGPTVGLELLPSRALWLDTTAQLVTSDAYSGVGGYADLFVDWLGPGGVTLMAGLAWDYEPVEELDDVGVTAFLRLQHLLTRTSPSAPRGAAGGSPATPPPASPAAAPAPGLR